MQVKLLDGPILAKSVDITAHLTSSDAIFELALVTDALRRKYGKGLFIRAIVPYVPYARQDRAMTSGEALSLKVFTDFLNSLKFDSVEVWDVHSDVSLALIDNVRNISLDHILGPEEVGDSILVSPDSGSLKKVSKIAQVFKRPMVRADKTRSVIDGSITGTVVYSESVGDKDFLIVDDICDGGKTFIELAKELRKLTTGKTNLYVTHGIFSKGLDALAPHIDTVYCAVPFPGVDLKHPILKVTQGVV